jgi:O-antigen/teichoic acid export membrane protein
VKKDIFVLLATLFYASLVKFATLILCYRFLTKEDVGLYIFATSFSLTLLIVANLNINLVFVRRISRWPLSIKEETSSLMIIRIATGLLFLGLILALSLLLGYGKNIVRFFLIASFVLLDDFYVSFNYLFIAVKKVFYSVWLPVLTYTGFIVLLIALLQAPKPAIETVILAQLIRTGVLLAAAALLTQARISPLTLAYHKEKVMDQLRQTPPFLLAALAFMSYGPLAVFWLGQLQDFSAVTPLGIALSVVNIFIIIPKVIISVVFPQASKPGSSLGGGDIFKYSLFIFAFSLVLVVVIGQSAPLVFHRLLGASSLEAIRILRPLVWVLPGIFLSHFFMAMLQAKNKERPAVRMCLFWLCSYALSLPLAFAKFKMPGLLGTMISVYLLQSLTLGLYAFRVIRSEFKAENAIV